MKKKTEKECAAGKQHTLWQNVKAFWKKETVLCIAAALAVVSSGIVLPDKEYLTYIDFHTLAILFCLMSVMAGLQKQGVFDNIARRLLTRVKSSTQIIGILLFLCFFFSMLITNDVALITFVPFTFIVLRCCGERLFRQWVIPVVVLQTIAANLGSMLTPIGNPQNLYLYGKAGLSLGAFVQWMLPYTAVAFVLLLLCTIWLGKTNKHQTISVSFAERKFIGQKRNIAVYLFLFVLCILSVAHVLSVWITLAVVLVTVLFLDRQVLAGVDYALLATFVGFFVFIGNMGRIPVFREFLQSIVSGHEVVTAILSSQLISNVPAALLLSGFTTDWKALLIGTNLGGLGTMIASMASLISYKYIAGEAQTIGDHAKRRYLLMFSAANVVFLLLLVIVYSCLSSHGLL